MLLFLRRGRRVRWSGERVGLVAPCCVRWATGIIYPRCGDSWHLRCPFRHTGWAHLHVVGVNGALETSWITVMKGAGCNHRRLHLLCFSFFITFVVWHRALERGRLLRPICPQEGIKALVGGLLVHHLTQVYLRAPLRFRTILLWRIAYFLWRHLLIPVQRNSRRRSRYSTSIPLSPRGIW